MTRSDLGTATISNSQGPLIPPKTVKDLKEPIALSERAADRVLDVTLRFLPVWMPMRDTPRSAQLVLASPNHEGWLYYSPFHHSFAQIPVNELRCHRLVELAELEKLLDGSAVGI